MSAELGNVLVYICFGIMLMLSLMSCSSEQLKRGTYYSIHEKQRQDCLNQGRKDCDQYEYENYDEYQRRRQEQ